MNESAIFSAALEKETGNRRRVFLDEACAGDEKLRQRVEALLQAHAQSDDILDVAGKNSATADFAPITEKAGSRIGPYRLMEQIGEGGFGVVFVAEQQEPVRRKVALKLIKPGMDSSQVIARFQAERQALAMMDHPNIARVLDAGATDTGRPYFVMELVRGIPITEYCDKNQLTPAERMEIFVTVCNAIQHAHQKGIIHRDIKPSNVLVTSHDGKPVAKVIDFGVAKAIHQQLTERTIYTQFAQMIGTPLYMSPEQAEMSGLDIDTRSDIYSLGVLLYELFTGSTPLEKSRLVTAAYDEVRRMIREDEPLMPSQRLSASAALPSLAANRKTEPGRLSKLMKGELDWIVMKSLEKDRTRRYETASAFGADIGRYLRDEQVEACPPSTTYRLRKFIRRNRFVFASSSFVAAALLLGVIVSTAFAIRAQVALLAEEQARIRAEELEQSSSLLRKKAEEAGTKEAAHRITAEQERDIAKALSEELAIEKEELSRQKEEQRRMLYTSDMNLIQSAWDADKLSRVHELLNAHRPQPGQSDLRGFEWHYWNRLCHSDLRTVKLRTNGLRNGGAFSHDGTVVSSVSNDGKRIATAPITASGPARFLNPLTLLNPNTMQVDRRKNVVTMRDEAGNVLHETAELCGPIEWLKFSADGRRLTACAVAREGDILTAAQLCVWDTASGAEQLTLRLSAAHVSGPRRAPPGEFSPDGSKLAAILLSGPAGARRTFIKTWNIDSRREDWESEKVQYPLGVLKFSPDGERILSSSSGSQTPSSGSQTTVWDAGNGRMLWRARPGVIECGFSADRSQIFGRVKELGDAKTSLEIKVWDAGSGRELQTIRDPELIFDGVSRVIVPSPNGRWLAVGQLRYSSVKIWDLSRPEREPYTLKGHSRGIEGIAFTPDSRRIATCTADNGILSSGGETKLWDAETGQELLTLPGAARNIRFSAEGSVLLAESVISSLSDMRIRRWDASRLSPQVEAELLVEALASRRGAEPLPLVTEILARIDADQDLSQDAREAAVALVKALRREKELNETAKAIAAQPRQPRAQYERALHYLQEACETDTDNQESWSTRGLVHYRLGQPNEVLKALARSQELLDRKKLAPSAEDLTVRAMVQHQLAKLDEARTTLEQARISASRNETAWQKLLAEAETLLSIGKADDHPELWIGRRFMPRMDERTEDENGISVIANIPYKIRKVAGDRLWFQTSQVELGAVSIARTRAVAFEDASRYYSAQLQATPDSATRDKANLYNSRGSVWRATGEFHKAVEDYSAAIRLVPTGSAPLTNRGQVWLETQNFEKSLADFNEALRLNKNDAYSHVYRGIVRTKQGELEDALRSFDKAIALSPKLGRIFTRRAYVWSAKGDLAQMMKDLDEGIRLSPEVSSTWSDRAWLLATSPNAEHRDGKEAVAAATAACKLSYNDFDDLDVLAAAYAETGDFEQAVKWQEKAVAMLPPSQRADYASRLKLYQEGKPYREPPAGATR